VQSTIHTEYKYKSIIVLNAKGKEMRNKCCGLLLEIRKSLIRKGMLALRVKEEVVVHIKYQYVNILHGGIRHYWTYSSSSLSRIFKAQLVPRKFMKYMVTQIAGVN
jgi:hypothetical protein